MVSIIFYEKPGCINNTKQKALLAAAGHEVRARNLLTESWTPQRLRSFFGNLPVTEWFNYSAPQVKSGEVVPDRLDAETALELMVSNPLLIRRPLMQVEDRHEVGFDLDRVDGWIGLRAIDDRQRTEDLQTCPHTKAS
jgi:nitrogenase-associated protein